jgi:type IV pilus assembly protein PilY1
LCAVAGGRDTANITTATAHNFQTGQTINIFGTGAFTLPAGPFTGYDGTWVVQSVPSSTTFTIFNACIDQVVTPLTVPAAGFTGFTVTAIAPTTSTTTSNPPASKPIYMWRYLTQADSDRPLSSGSGVMTAGRPSDSDATVRDLIVAWARSTDNKDNENTDCTLSPFFPCVTGTNDVPRLSDVRASAHSDVLHSRPATINYNRYGDDNDIYAYYGSNDGVLHAVKGGIAQHATGADSALVPGIERWGFLPKEFFPKLKRLRDQFPTISNINQKDYFFDGSIGVYLKDARGNGLTGASGPLNCVPGSCAGADTVAGILGDNIHPTAGDKVQLYLSLRRGGNFMYSLDVLNPATPKLLWRKGNGDTGWSQVGQTWSEPKITRTQANLGNASNPDNVIVIFGAGYDDAVEDINPCLLAESHPDRVVPLAVGSGTVTYTASGSCTITGGPGGTATPVSRKFGRGLMVIDAFSGNVLWQAGAAPDAGATVPLTVPGMSCAIASDVTVLDKDRNGFADRLYVGDTCGSVWRADISDPDPRSWAVTQIASLSGTDPRIITDKIKFLFPPDLVFAQDTSGNYTAVLLGSGDREHPFDATVQNSFFMIKDRDATSLVGAPNNTTVSIARPSPDTSLAAPLTKSDLFDATNAVVDNTVPVAANGWFVDMRAGEKVVGSAVTIAGTTFFNTNQPSSTAGGGACGSNLGLAREYLVGFADAGATVDLNGLGTMSIANRSTIHAGGGYLPSPVPVVVEIDGKKYQAVISGTSVQTPPGLTLEKRTRAFWYKQID